MRDLIRQILREELSLKIKRRVNFKDVDEKLNELKLNTFKWDVGGPIEDMVRSTVLKLAHSLISVEVDRDTEEYSLIFKELKKYLKQKYAKDLESWFTKVRQVYKDVGVMNEQLSNKLRRRIDIDKIEKIINKRKIEKFQKNQDIEKSIYATIQSVMYDIMPDGFEYDTTEYYKVWDELKDFIKQRYFNELSQYFEKRQKDVDEETNPLDYKYIFVKHDKPYYNVDWRGFADGFDSFDDMITKYGNWVDVNWDEIKKKLDNIKDFPENTYTGRYNSRPIRISSIGDDGNEWGYNFSVMKSIPHKNLHKVGTITEATELPLKLKRRFKDIDWRVEFAIKEFRWQQKNICVGFQTFLSVIIEKVCDSMYWDNFAHEMDDSSKEWYEIYKALEEYLQEKYIFELQKYYHINCGD